MYTSFPTFLAAAEPTVVNLVVTGFLFVVVILSILSLATFLGGKIFAKRDEKSAPAPVKHSGPSAADVIQQKEEVEGRVAAVISAAVHVALADRRFRVRAIRRAAPGWAQEGRRQIFSSHRLR